MTQDDKTYIEKNTTRTETTKDGAVKYYVPTFGFWLIWDKAGWSVDGVTGHGDTIEELYAKLRTECQDDIQHMLRLNNDVKISDIDTSNPVKAVCKTSWRGKDFTLTYWLPSERWQVEGNVMSDFCGHSKVKDTIQFMCEYEKNSIAGIIPMAGLIVNK